MATGVRSWVVDIENSVASYDQATEEKCFVTPSIFRVPAFIRDWKAKAFTPQVVSFGPYHHGAENLKPVEEHKRRALVHFLRRARRPLDHFVKEMEDVVQQLQDSYHGLDEKWRDRDQFLRLMIFDGCFMLEVLRSGDEKYRKAYVRSDPVFSRHGEFHRMPYIKRDMLVFENQLPLLVLKRLLIAERLGCYDDAYINELVLKFFGEELKAGMTADLALHPLDIYRKSRLHGASDKGDPRVLVSHADPLLSAEELYEAGVHFRVSKSPSLMDIEFKDDTLTLPVHHVDDTTESVLFNIVAFEHLHVGTGYQVTSYVAFMDDIIDSAKDVTLLHRKDIIKNATGSNEDVARLFGSFSKEVTLDPGGKLAQVRHKVNRYRVKPWNCNKWWAHLKRTKFRSPWAAIGLAAAILAIVLTIVQTVYGILQFHLRKG